MGFLGDLESGLAMGGGAGTFLAKDAIDRMNRPPAGTPAYVHEDKYNPYSSSSNADIIDLYNKIYPGGSNPYLGTFNQAYANLGQPMNESGPNLVDRNNITARGTEMLAENFIDNYHKQFNVLPDENTIRDFVAQNLDSGFANKVIQGNINSDQIGVLSKNYIANNNIAPPNYQTPGQLANNTQQSALANQISGLYDQYRGILPQQVEQAYAPAKNQAAESLAAQGDLYGSPASRYSLNQIEGEKANALTGALGNLSLQQANSGSSLASTLANLQQSQAQLKQQGQQFGQNLAFQKQQYDTGQNQFLQQQQLAKYLGQLQAGANKPGNLDYLNSAFKGLGTAAQAYAAFA